MTDIYTPRFTNGGDEPSGDASTRKDEVHGTSGTTSLNPFIVGGWYGMDDDGYSFACPPDNGVYIANEEQSERFYQEKLIRMGDASKEGSVACGAELVEIGQPSPTYTREELVEIMAEQWGNLQ